jgi:DNA topoisomerase-1
MNYKVYLNDTGISKNGKKYHFNDTKQQVKDQVVLARLDKIYTPPAWRNVWYASNPKCHIQAHGIDAGGKKQYILSEKWKLNARFEKYNRMKRFIKHIKSFKRRIKLGNYEDSREFLIKLLFNLLIDLHIRVGNEIYASSNKTYGLTTLRQRHLIKSGNVYNINFTGKSHIKHSIAVPERYNVYFNHLKKDNSDNSLFFYNKDKTIDSEDLNEYLKRYMGNEYTCKDFRTYSANILFIHAFLKNARNGGIKKNVKSLILECIDSTAQQLGHSRNISRKSYISNTLLDYCSEFFDSASSSTVDELVEHVSN